MRRTSDGKDPAVSRRRLETRQHALERLVVEAMDDLVAANETALLDAAGFQGGQASTQSGADRSRQRETNNKARRIRAERRVAEIVNAYERLDQEGVHAVHLLQPTMELVGERLDPPRSRWTVNRRLLDAEVTWQDVCDGKLHHLVLQYLPPKA